MSITSFFKTAEEGAEKVAGFVIKEMTAAENLLGAKTGSLKANLVITAVESAMGVLGVNIGSASAELADVLKALTTFFNKVGLFTTSGSTTPPPPAA